MEPIDKLTKIFSEFPGIGPRQASRFVYYLLHKGKQNQTELIEALKTLETAVKPCESCFRFFKSRANNNLCEICTSQNRNKKQLMLVVNDADLTRIEKSGEYFGLYFVLGGFVPILEENPEKRIRQKDLLSKVSKLLSQNELREIIIATNATPDGENTTDYIYSILKTVLHDSPVTISSFGRGFSTGTEIEYSDPDTIRHALKNRTIV